MGSSQVLKAIAKGASDAMCPAQALRLAVSGGKRKLDPRRVDSLRCLEFRVAAGNRCGPIAGTRPAADLLGNHGGPTRRHLRRHADRQPKQRQGQSDRRQCCDHDRRLQGCHRKLQRQLSDAGHRGDARRYRIGASRQRADAQAACRHGTRRSQRQPDEPSLLSRWNRLAQQRPAETRGTGHWRQHLCPSQVRCGRKGTAQQLRLPIPLA